MTESPADPSPDAQPAPREDRYPQGKLSRGLGCLGLGVLGLLVAPLVLLVLFFLGWGLACMIRGSCG